MENNVKNLEMERDLRIAMLENRGAVLMGGNAPVIDHSIEFNLNDGKVFIINADTAGELIDEATEVVREYGGLPYYVMIKNTPFGVMGSVLYVSKYDEEWEMDRDELREGNYVHAYVHNYDVPEFSEFGGICYDIQEGVIVRTDI